MVCGISFDFTSNIFIQLILTITLLLLSANVNLAGSDYHFSKTSTMNPTTSLAGKTILITGASSGIGRACAEVFSSAGARLILLARREQILQEVVQSLGNSETYSIICDVRNQADVHSAIASLPVEWKDIDILINNAGLSRGLATLQDGLLSDWEEMIDTNLKGLLYVTQTVLPIMLERKSGMIINIASIAGRQTYPKGNVYCATKSAVRTLSEALQFDLNGTGIRVSNIDPGMVETEFSLVRFHGDKERADSVYKGMTPLTPYDVAETALFCATRPAHVSIQDILLMPTDQASATVVHRTS